MRFDMVEITNAASSTGEWKGRVHMTEFGKVLRHMRADGRVWKPGEVLSPEFLAALPRANKQALIDGKWIEVHAMSAEVTK
jgi:hypothetical protein